MVRIRVGVWREEPFPARFRPLESFDCSLFKPLHGNALARKTPFGRAGLPNGDA